MWQHWEDGASRPARQAVVIALQLAPHDRHHDEAAAPLAACPSRQARSQGPIGGLLDSAAEIPPSIVLAAAVIALHQLKPFLAVGRMVDRRALDARSLRRRLSRAASGPDVVCAAAISPAAMLSPFAALIPSILSFDLWDPRVGAERFDAAGLGGKAPPGFAGGIDDGVVVVMQPVREEALLEVEPDALDRV